MKLLMITPNYPSPSWGASTRNYHLLKALSRKHTVSLIAAADQIEIESYEHIARLKEFTEQLHVIISPKPSSKRLKQLKDLATGKSYILNAHTSAKMQQIVDDVLSREHYDAVQFETMQMAGYRLPQDIKVIIDQHNVEYELLQRTFEHEKSLLRKVYNWRESQLIKKAELERCRSAHLVLTTSEHDRLTLKSMLPRNVIEVVPNGVDTEAFRRNDSVIVVPHQIIFTGTMDYYPNIDAALFFAQKCWPLIRNEIPDATWVIVGRNPPPEVQQLAELPGVTVTGAVPDVKPYLAASAVAIAPLQIGSGTRLKILEALAMQKAVVSTSIGCEGLAVESGRHLLIADQSEAFARAVISLIHDSELCNTVSTGGRALVETTYSWEYCGNKLLDFIDNL